VASARQYHAFSKGWAEETVKVFNNIPEKTDSVGWGELANPNNQW